MFQYHQYEEEENKSTLISFSTLVLTRASEEVPANLLMTALRDHGKLGRWGWSKVNTSLLSIRSATYVVTKNGESGFIPGNVCFLSSKYQSKVSIFSHKYRVASMEKSHEEGMHKATALSSHKATNQFELAVHSRESVFLLFSDGQ